MNGESSEAGRGVVCLEQAIDRSHLSRQTLGDVSLEREVLALFRRQSDLMLARLAEARGGEERRIAAHTLKGSARAVGAWRVADAAEAVETAPAEPSLRMLRGAVGEAHAAIELLLAS